MGPTWVLSAPDGPHFGPIDLAIRAGTSQLLFSYWPRQSEQHGTYPNLSNILSIFYGTCSIFRRVKPLDRDGLDIDPTLSYQIDVSSTAIREPLLVEMQTDHILFCFNRQQSLVLLKAYIGASLDPVISWWRHQMETFSALLAICAGNSPVSGEFPAQRPVTQASDAELWCFLWYAPNQTSE